MPFEGIRGTVKRTLFVIANGADGEEVIPLGRCGTGILLVSLSCAVTPGWEAGCGICGGAPLLAIYVTRLNESSYITENGEQEARPT
jgi:hypothetical protein